MSVFDTMLVRNQEFAAQVSSTGRPMPSLPKSLPGEGAHYYLRRYAGRPGTRAWSRVGRSCCDA
jgi:hypothetical protein